MNPKIIFSIINQWWLGARNFTLFLIFLIIFTKGIFLFVIGFHNMDVCNNEMHIAKDIENDLAKDGIDINVNITEMAVYGGKEVELKECFIHGIDQMFSGFFIVIIGSFGLGIVASKL